jgi:hypothetical protein
MPVQMIEMEEVTMVETSDESLEVAGVGVKSSTGMMASSGWDGSSALDFCS